MRNTWVLVAESSRAKLYTVNGRLAPITEIEALVHPESRMHEGDLVSDSAGSDGGSVGQGRHVIDSKNTARDHESLEFARTLASRLDSARNNGDFDNLVLIAPPEFLGHLRGNLSKEVLSMVSRQVDKNLVQKPAEVLRNYL
ncbi:MAG: host attachment protein [Thiogranum sp.]|jgi:protein required for attachment to host cells